MRFFQALAVGALLPASILFTPLASAAPESLPSEPALEEVVVSATLLRDQDLQHVPASVTVLDAPTLSQPGQQHFEDVLAQVPNLNWAGGTSRPRYFQIRGIGEREQYEGAPNPSVGFLVDEVDFSGIGMVATLFDVSQVEVLRGPQGTRLGANALAGLISFRSTEPADTPAFSIEATGADYDTGSVGFIANAPVESLNSAWRVSVQKFRSDGFRDDLFLHRKDTNDRDELSARAKWRWNASDNTTLDLTLLHSDIDNGYDAWSIDNTWTSESDRPGVDTQRANAASVRLVSSAWTPATLTVIGAYAKSDSVNSFDADWGNEQLWAPYTYDYFSRSDRDRTTGSLEVRLASAAPKKPGDIAWLFGVYGLRLTEDGRDTSNGVYADPFFPELDTTLDEFLDSRFHAHGEAVFGQLDGLFTDRLHWSAGARVERRTSAYTDSGFWQGEARVSDLDERNTMTGGQATLSYDLSSSSTAYASISRGYKAGGFNLGHVPQDRLTFRPEFLWNYEVGLKRSFLDGRLFADSSAFYSRRKNVQVRTGDQLDPSDPTTFVFFTDNASGGYNYGLETSVRWQISAQWDMNGSLGLLRTRYLDYVQGGLALPDREQAHAPNYQAAVSLGWRHPTGWNGRATLTALDHYYFDVPPNDTQSSAYALTNLQFGYQSERWSAYAWARNVFDRTYAIRGFFFGNVPPDFPNQLYVQRGDPRQVGITFHYSFR
ncbi:MAG TPA: TonB-dependent receptor [Steroidobacteraceae bacterium]|jgi:outer membrane receptor protein involved in Fe transport